MRAMNSDLDPQGTLSILGFCGKARANNSALIRSPIILWM
jgi:hypothetical protein